MTDTTNKPGDTLEDNVRYLLSRCPWTVKDMSGERTGSRAKEDLAGSLAITFVSLEQTIRDFAEAITEVQTASTALEGRKAWARVDGLLKRCRTRGAPAGEAQPSLDGVEPVSAADNQWFGDMMILQVLADSDHVNEQEREVLTRWLAASDRPANGTTGAAPTAAEEKCDTCPTRCADCAVYPPAAGVAVPREGQQ